MKVWPKTLPTYAPEGADSAALAPVPAAAPAVEPAPAAEPAPSAVPNGAMDPDPVSSDDGSFDKILAAFEQDEPDDLGEPDVIEATAPAPQPVLSPAETPVATPPVGAQPPVAAPTAPVPVAPAPTPAVVQQAPTPAQPQGVPVPSAPPPQVVAEQPGPPTQGFNDIAEGLKKQKADLVNAVAQQNYALSDQDLEEFASDPRKVIGRVAAAAQIETTASVMRVLAEQLPVVVNGIVEARMRNQQAEDEFWAANRHLDKTKHKAEALQTYQQIRALQPNLAKDEGIRLAGQWMALRHGIPYVPNGAAAPTQSAAPTQQVVHTPGPVVRTPVPGGFIPAGPQAAPASSHPQPAKSPMDRFFDTFVLDEKGAFEE